MPGRNLRHATAGCVIDYAEAPNGCQQTGPTGGLWTRPLGLNRRIIDYKCVCRYRSAPSGANFLFARQHEAACAADAAACIGASVSALERRTVAAYHFWGERREQYIGEHQQPSFSRKSPLCNDFQTQID